MCGRHINAALEAFTADNECGKALSAVIVIILFARVHLHAEFKGYKSLFLKQSDSCLYTFALRLAVIEEFCIALCIFKALLCFLFIHLFKSIFALEE